MSAANSSPEAAPRLPRLWWWDDGVERSGAAHMAVDELLFSSHPEVPVLRAYRWLAPAVSFGYAERFEPVHARFSGQAREFVRRWTGGGVVPHGGDMTYTLVLPATVRGAWKNSVAVYRMVHQALADALCRDGLPAVMVESGRQSTGTLCFAAPVRYDVLADGAKSPARDKGAPRPASSTKAACKARRPARASCAPSPMAWLSPSSPCPKT